MFPYAQYFPVDLMDLWSRWTNEKHKKNTILCLPHTRYKSPRWPYDFIYMLYIIANTNSGHKTSMSVGTKLSRNVPWMVLYKLSVFGLSRIFNMAATANNMLWLAEISKILFSETNELTKPKLPILILDTTWITQFRITMCLKLINKFICKVYNIDTKIKKR
jgi:hypothetical protein